MITMKCVSSFFTKNGLLKNIASYILLFIIFLFLLSIVLFYKCGYNLLEDDIYIIIKEKEKREKENLNIKETIDAKNEEKKNKIIKNKKTQKKEKMKHKKSKSKERKKENGTINLHINDNSKSISQIELNSNKNFLNITKKNKLKKSKSKLSLNFNDYELNSLSYIKAIKNDKRKFIDYYISLIKTKHPIIFSFCPIKDYNSMIIKIDLFFLSLSIYCFINCLFFDEKMIHKIYLDEGTYNLKYLITYISYSFLISHTLFTIIKYFSLSERNIGEIKKGAKDKGEQVLRVLKCIKIKYICFYCLSLLFLFFFWYYLSSFGAVYQNTQIFLIKNIVISFSFSLLYPFIINIIPCLLRMYSLKNPNTECLFKCSKFIQII